MWGRKKETAAIAADIDEARESRLRGEQAVTHVQSQWPAVESLVSTIRQRRERNGFGDDYRITLQTRKSA